MTMTRRRKLMVFAPLAIVGLVLFVALGGQLVKLLWNWLLPPLVGVPAITFWQAIGLLALSRILFGGFGFRGGPSSRMRHRMSGRWEQMTPEERERFRQGLHGRCGPDRLPGAEPESSREPPKTS